MEEHTAILDGHSSQTSDVQVTPRYQRQFQHIKTQATTPLKESEHVPLLFVPLIRSWNYIWKYRVSLLLIVIMILLIYILAKPGCRIKGKFTNKSSSGFYYDTDDLSFHTPQDRALAVKALLDQLNADGNTYTSDQISSLASSFIIMVLEPEDDDDQKVLKARVSILVDPTYKAVFTSAEKARRNNSTFASNQERVMLYNLLVKYFDSLVNRLTSILPIQDQELYGMYEVAIRTFWSHDEVDLTNDVVQWNEKLSDGERTFLSHVLGFFVQADQLVNINLGDRFLIDIENIPDRYRKYCRLFYNAQMMIEDIHTLSYETMLNEFISDPELNHHFKKSIANIPCIAKKADWAAKYINDKESGFPIRLIAFAILEGIFFSGSFCSIFWMEQKNLMRGLVQYNKFISRDENLHYSFALTLFRKLRDDESVEFDVDVDTIANMIEDAVAIEAEFINQSIPCAMIGMNTDLMTQYIKYVADQLLIDIQMEPIYKVPNPFSFMIALGVPDRANFFESRESIYSKAIDAGIDYDSDASDF